MLPAARLRRSRRLHRTTRLTAVTALGRVTPGRTVISIAAQPGSRILRLDAAEGQRVAAGDVLATLEAHPLRIAERDAARVALAEARERLDTELSTAPR